MARKERPGIRYYSQDSDHVLNTKIKLLYNEFDSNGYWVYQCLLCEIYNKRGYYLDLNDRDGLIMFASDVCKKQVSLVDEIISGCVRRGLFDKAVFDMFAVLTSDRIQDNYLAATQEMRKKSYTYEVFKEYWLVDIPKNISLISLKNDNSENESDYSREKQELFPGIIPQSKVKESKEEESKENVYTRDADFENGVLKYFGFSEISHFQNFKILSECCAALFFSGRLEEFKKQFPCYRELKDITGYKHSFQKFLGQQSEKFTDGAWCAENWEMRLAEERKSKNGKNNQRSSGQNQRSTSTGSTPAAGYGKV